MVNVDSSMASEDDINNAIMAIRRNGVALKGKCLMLCELRRLQRLLVQLHDQRKTIYNKQIRRLRHDCFVFLLSL